MNLPFESVGPARLDLKDLRGAAMLVCVGGFNPAKQTRSGDAPAIYYTAVILSGPHAGEEEFDRYLFNSGPIRQLRGSVGKAKLVHVDTESFGGIIGVVFREPSPEETAAATAWVEKNPGRLEELIDTAVAGYAADLSRTGLQAPRPIAQSVGREPTRPSDPPSVSSQLPTGRPFTSVQRDDPPF